MGGEGGEWEERGWSGSESVGRREGEGERKGGVREKRIECRREM